MRKNYFIPKKISIIILIILFVFLYGCNSDYPISISQDTYTYLPTHVSISEPQANERLSQVMSYLYEEDTVKYYFSETIDLTLRDKFINSQKYILNYLQAKGYIENIPSAMFYVLKEYNSRTESENSKAFFDIDDTLTYKQILITLQAYFGDFTNYGMLYGISNIISKELKWETDNPVVSTKNIIDFTEATSNLDYFDLTYPCFLEAYVGEVLPMIKAISIRLMTYLMKNEEVNYVVDVLNLQNESPDLYRLKASEMINNWLESIGSTTNVSARDTSISFTYGGNKTPLIISSDHAKYYLLNNFTEVRMDVTQIDYFHSDYFKLIEVIVNLELDMKASDEIFSDYMRPNDFFSVVLCSEAKVISESNSIAYYSEINQTAYSSSAIPISHEYLHYLTTPINEYNWQYESIAIYYNLDSSFERITSQNTMDARRYYESAETTALLEYLGRDFQNEDFPTFCDVFYVLNELNSVSASNPYAMISIANYVKNTYGDETLRKVFLQQNTIEEEISLSWQELIDEWNQWLIDQYSYLR
ncbi:MAG: hypothetical protein KJ971_02715 [Firmicutes bacterium]|nr:hypothetical protein [Bacillota bacterium]